MREREVIICADFWTVTGNEMPVLCYFIIGFWAPGERIHTLRRKEIQTHRRQRKLITIIHTHTPTHTHTHTHTAREKGREGEVVSHTRWVCP